MKKKLRIGDKVRWNVPVGGDTIYTIMDIDTSRPVKVVAHMEFKEEVLFQWLEDGLIRQTWSSSIDDLNKNLNKGGITIVERSIEPNKELLKFSL